MKVLGNSTFYGCYSLKKIYVADGCEADLSYLEIPDSTKVGPLPETMIGNVRVWDLRDSKKIVIPDGVERIGSYWFWGSEAESVEISASVKEIGMCAFRSCKNLTRVVFAEGSRLERIRTDCFYGAGIEGVTIPKGVEEIQERAF